MSIFNELLLPKVLGIQNIYDTIFNEELKAALESFDKFEEEFQKGRATVREKTLKDKNAQTILESITEDEDDKPKPTDKPKTSDEHSSTECGKENRGPKKRSKNEVDDMLSPEQDKRVKRNASVKAQSIISKQNNEESVIIVSSEVNVNLTQKLRRENSTEKKSRRRKDDEKENNELIPAVQIKQEKISIPPEPEPMEMESLPVNIEIKRDPSQDDIAMPPPAIPKSRKAAQKKKSHEGEAETTERSARSKKQTDEPIRASTRSTRASSRATKKDGEEMDPPPAETRPKRTRAKKVTPEVSEDGKRSQSVVDSSIASPADKRPKRTRRGRKASDKQEPPQAIASIVQTPETISPKEERISIPETTTDSPILQKTITKKKHKQSESIDIEKPKNGIIKPNGIVVENGIYTGFNGLEMCDAINETYVTATSKACDETRVLETFNTTVTLSKDLDKDVVLPNGDIHAEIIKAMNETVVIEKDNTNKQIMDATVVLEKDPKPTNVTDDNSLMTDDDSIEEKTPPLKPTPLPTSAVKEKVQQFEEMASRVTRTKTRALAKKEESKENQTPPDKTIPSSVASDTLAKMNNLIFKSKMPQVSHSASKPTANTPVTKSQIPMSTSKLSGINRAREAAEELKREKEDARRKKEALLEAKREMHKRKREEKMAAAAAAREASERERRAALAAAARERQEKLMLADMSKQERLKEMEKKKLEYARKVAETEERRRAEEIARQKKLEEEQKKAEERRKQLEEADLDKREAVLLKREMDRKNKEYQEKLKMKQKLESEKMPTPLKYRPDPVYMEGGFQYLNSDEEAEPERRADPDWSTSKTLRRQACIQDRLMTSDIDKLFSVREQTADLREIFPTIDRSRLKRTSSAVWRTPPRLPAVTE
ncbi:inner centromere protein isoform X2 [Pieris napi]|uniref:inner centromere protein isoform X2 n=1 Tax=Pieris napi TaxID=78633 RepID=UPI001FB9BBAF|nr:inner centromere protein isoform X2 [Pieris napi]